MFTMQEKREAVERELKYRKRVYPRRIENGHMTPALAKRQIDLMEAIVADYQEMEKKDRLL